MELPHTQVLELLEDFNDVFLLIGQYSQFFPAQRFSAATFGVRGVRFTMLFPPP